MKFLKLTALALTAIASFGLTSCGCCTSEPPAPPLRPLPDLGNVDGTPKPVYYAK